MWIYIIWPCFPKLFFPFRNTYSWVDSPGSKHSSGVLQVCESHTGRIQHQRAAVSQSEGKRSAAAAYFYARSLSVHLCTRPHGSSAVTAMRHHGRPDPVAGWQTGRCSVDWSVQTLDLQINTPDRGFPNNEERGRTHISDDYLSANLTYIQTLYLSTAV